VASYTISNKASQDLEDIYLYTFRKWSEQQADRYYRLLLSELEFLAENPLTAESMEHIRPGYRKGILKEHLIFFKIIDDSSIHIIRVLHQKMDVKSKL